MSPELSNKQWLPSTDIEALKARAEMYAQIRKFFYDRNVLEVETPLLCSYAVTDPYIQAFAIASGGYLQTSPEYAMKRLLAAGSGSIYQICKAFRQEEIGKLHNCEFTMLEWYRLGFDHTQLYSEVDDLLQAVLNCPPSHRLSYLSLFEKHLGINPHIVEIPELQKCAAQHGINLSPNAALGLSVTDWLHLLMSHVIEPELQGDRAWIIYDFPLAQAALAKVDYTGKFPLAGRFEVYMNGIELANGYYELQDVNEQRQRFIADNSLRKEQNLPQMRVDERLISALEHGLPDCAGVALGLDRLLMLKTSATSIDQIISFTSDNV